jgi:molybdopterin synthase catalytic subunit
MFKIYSTPLDAVLLKESLQTNQAGACVIFEGWVRDFNEGKSVLSLEYEAYTALAEKEGNEILAEAFSKHKILKAHAYHRVGNLALGELAVWVGVTAEHREDAFLACRFLIDEIKARVPIWKREHYRSGSRAWINCATRGEHKDATR